MYLDTEKVYVPSLNYRKSLIFFHQLQNMVSSLPNYQNRLFYLPWWFYIFFHRFSPLSLFSLNWGSKCGSKIMKIGVVVEVSTKTQLSKV